MIKGNEVWHDENFSEVQTDVEGKKLAVLTKYINELEDAEVFGEWVVDRKNDGSPERPIQFP